MARQWTGQTGSSQWTRQLAYLGWVMLNLRYSVVTVGIDICLWRAYREATEERCKCAPVQSRVYQEWEKHRREKHQRVQRTLFSGSHWTLGPRYSQWLADEPTTAQASVAHTAVAPHTFPRLPVSAHKAEQRVAHCGWFCVYVQHWRQEQNLQEKHRKTTKTTSDGLHTAPWWQ